MTGLSAEWIPRRVSLEYYIETYILGHGRMPCPRNAADATPHTKGTVMAPVRSPESILSDIAAIDMLERGKLCEVRGSAGGVYHNLQFWAEGRNRCEYIRATDLAAVQEAVGNWQRYQALTDEYAAAVERRTRRARGVAQKDPKKGGSAKRPSRRPAGRSTPSSTGSWDRR